MTHPKHRADSAASDDSEHIDHTSEDTAPLEVHKPEQNESDVENHQAQGSDDVSVQTEPITTIAQPGYIYVTEDSLHAVEQGAEDDSLSHQLLRNGTVFEKKSLAEKIRERNEQHAEEKARKQKEAEYRARQAAIAGLTAQKAAQQRALTTGSLNERDVLTHAAESTVEATSRKGIVFGALGVGALLLAGIATVYAFNHSSDNITPTDAHTVKETATTSPTATESPRATFSPAPAPTHTVKEPEVKYLNPTPAPVAPGTIEYVDPPVPEVPVEQAPPPVIAPQPPVVQEPEPTVQSTTAEPTPSEEPVESSSAPEPTTQEADSTQEPTEATVQGPTVAPPASSLPAQPQPIPSGPSVPPATQGEARNTAPATPAGPQEAHDVPTTAPVQEG
ncbi:hypothetical protein [Rothia sp. CCM 9419]|uniref:hypothetical protein n=1 Tax=Rothia sp. CCM 9419 TaxID=3402662 RepID=UPI003AEC3AAD